MRSTRTVSPSCGGSSEAPAAFAGGDFPVWFPGPEYSNVLTGLLCRSQGISRTRPGFPSTGKIIRATQHEILLAGLEFEAAGVKAGEDFRCGAPGAGEPGRDFEANTARHTVQVSRGAQSSAIRSHFHGGTFCGSKRTLPQTQQNLLVQREGARCITHMEVIFPG